MIPTSGKSAELLPEMSTVVLRPCLRIVGKVDQRCQKVKLTLERSASLLEFVQHGDVQVVGMNDKHQSI